MIGRSASPRQAARRRSANRALRRPVHSRAVTEARLPGWVYRIRTGESVRELPDWNCVTTWAEVGASWAAETCSRSSCNERICSSGQDQRDAAYRVILSFAAN
jgi:hypothetical protein